MTVGGKWTFFRAGGFDQVKLATGADLANLRELDQKLWVALACPTSGLELDPRTLALIDGDKDGRVRAPELLAAVEFATRNLKNPNDLLKRQASLPLRAINNQIPEGKKLLASAKQVLKNLGKAEETAIAAEDLKDPTRVFADTPFNGDGVITELSTTDEALRAVVRDVITCLGSEPDRSGKPGVNAAKIETFFEQLGAYASWQSAANDDPQIWPLDRERTAAAAASVAAIRGKVEDYFARCRLATFDPRLVQLLNRKEEEYQAIAASELSLDATAVAGFPLAQVGPGRNLPLQGGINPAHGAAIQALREAAVIPLLGPRAHLTEEDWATLMARLAPYHAWLSRKPALPVEPLGVARIQEILASNAKEALLDLVAQDQALEAEAASIENVERLVRYYRDLYLLCTNFINFQTFYASAEPAVFQCGTLYLDQRACQLCLRVGDPARHASIAALAGGYLVYADCSRPATGEKMQVVAVFTNGDSDNLMVGRNGLFYDRQGRDWDATVTKIVDKPISLRQAFWAPYKKLVRLIEEQVAKRAAAAESASDASLSAAATNAANVDKTAPAAQEKKKVDVGSVAALGVAVGAIGAFLTAVVAYATGIIQMGPLAVIGAIIGVMLLISTPSVILAQITLSKRNLGPLLDASGWAVNAKAKINVSFGAALTSVAKLPEGARRDFRDPYADRGWPWKRGLVLLFLVLLGFYWYRGSLDRFLPAKVQASQVLGAFAPAPPHPAPAAKPGA